MVKKISISLSEWVYDTYLSNIASKSRYIEEMLIKGVESSIGARDDVKNRLVQAIKRNHDLEETVNKQKLLIGSLTERLTGKKQMSPKLQKVIRLGKGLKSAGLLNDIAGDV